MPSQRIRVGMFSVLILSLAFATPLIQAAEPISPADEVIQLFNGQDLDGFYTWLRDTKYEDPRGVFAVHDGVLHISGDGFGYLATKEEYRDYRLVSEFKWGPRTWKPREQQTKDSGILLHATGPDGAAGGWMASIEFQVIEGGVGDFIVIQAPGSSANSTRVSLGSEVAADRDGESVWKQAGPRRTFTGGRINWFGRDPDWQDVLGFRGAKDIESPDGEWTRVEIVCRGGRIQNRVNGVLVNEGFAAKPQAGKILVQTECAEIFFRKLELHPLD